LVVGVGAPRPPKKKNEINLGTRGSTSCPIGCPAPREKKKRNQLRDPRVHQLSNRLSRAPRKQKKRNQLRDPRVHQLSNTLSRAPQKKKRNQLRDPRVHQLSNRLSRAPRKKKNEINLGTRGSTSCIFPSTSFRIGWPVPRKKNIKLISCSRPPVVELVVPCPAKKKNEFKLTNLQFVQNEISYLVCELDS
jgi:hypothetical protein